MTELLQALMGKSVVELTSLLSKGRTMSNDSASEFLALGVPTGAFLDEGNAGGRLPDPWLPWLPELAGRFLPTSIFLVRINLGL